MRIWPGSQKWPKPSDVFVWWSVHKKSSKSPPNLEPDCASRFLSTGSINEYQPSIFVRAILLQSRRMGVTNVTARYCPAFPPALPLTHIKQTWQATSFRPKGHRNVTFLDFGGGCCSGVHRLVEGHNQLAASRSLFGEWQLDEEDVSWQISGLYMTLIHIRPGLFSLQLPSDFRGLHEAMNPCLPQMINHTQVSYFHQGIVSV